MEAQVTNAQSHGGGWVILTYHHICSPIGNADCPADLSTTPTIFNAFATWLAGQSANGVSVKTVQAGDRRHVQGGGDHKPACAGRAGRERPGRSVADEHRRQYRVPELLPAGRLGYQYGGLGEHDQRAPGSAYRVDVGERHRH